VRVQLRSIESTLDVLHSKVLESVAASEWTRPGPGAAELRDEGGPAEERSRGTKGKNFG
jgi:hypothetical protein